jgi:3',5'-cyclic AMP phosphodiesterase CpdA
MGYDGQISCQLSLSASAFSLKLVSGLSMQITKLIQKFSLLLVAMVLTATAVHAATPVVRFAQISDTHIMANGPDSSWLLLADGPAILADMLDQLQNPTAGQNKADFIILTGNGVNAAEQAHLDTLMQVLQHAGLPVYACLGTRDVVAGGAITKPATIAAFRQLNPNSFNVLDRGYYSALPAPGVKLVVLDSSPQQGQGNLTGKGTVSKSQVQWLQQELQNTLDATSPPMVIVAMHHPVLEPFNSPAKRLPSAEAGQLLSVLQNSPVTDLVLSGAYQAAKIQQRQQLVHMSAPALVAYPMAARLFTVYDDGTMRVEWVPSRLKNLVQKSRSRSPWSLMAAGNGSSDQHWQGRLKYYPTPQQVANLKARQALAAASVKLPAKPANKPADKSLEKSPATDPAMAITASTVKSTDTPANTTPSNTSPADNNDNITLIKIVEHKPTGVKSARAKSKVVHTVKDKKAPAKTVAAKTTPPQKTAFQALMLPTPAPLMVKIKK